MTLVVASLVVLFILTSFASTKKLVAVLALIALFYIHLPVAIGLSVVLAAIYYHA